MKRGKKKQARHPVGRKTRSAGIALSLALGAILTCLAYYCLDSLAKPDLDVQLTASSESGRILVRLVNAGSRTLTLDLADVDCFVAPVPNVPQEYVIHIRNAAAGTHRDATRYGTILRPGDGVDVLDAMSLVAPLPAGRIVLSAVYSSSGEASRDSGFWHGFARSPPLAVIIG